MSVDWSLVTATAPPGGDLFRQVWPWLAALVVVVAVGAVVIYALRRYVSRGESGRDEGFTLQDLRELHASGSLTDEEFERAKASVIGRITTAADDQREADAPDEPGLKE